MSPGKSQISPWNNEPSSTQCGYCQIYVPQEYYNDTIKLCKGCSNLLFTSRLRAATRPMLYFSIILSLGIYLLDSKNSWMAIPVIGVAILPGLVASLYQGWIHTYKIEPNYRPFVFLRGYEITPSVDYYERSLLSTEKVESKPDWFKKNIIEFLLTYIVLDDEPTPFNWVDDWANALDMTPEEFVLFMYENQKKLYKEILKPKYGFGVLPDLWKVIKTLNHETIVQKTIFALNSYANDQSSYNEHEIQIFKDELYLVGDEIKAQIEELEIQKETKELIELLDSYEPEEPPTNPLSQRMALLKFQQAAIDAKMLVKSENSKR